MANIKIMFDNAAISLTSKDDVDENKDGDKWDDIEKHLKKNADSNAPFTVCLVVRDFVRSAKILALLYFSITDFF